MFIVKKERLTIKFFVWSLLYVQPFYEYAITLLVCPITVVGGHLSCVVNLSFGWVIVPILSFSFP